MHGPRWSQDEARLIKPEYFVVFNPLTERWEVRKWASLYWQNDWQLHGFSSFVRKSCLHDDQGRDIGFRPLDARLFYELKRGLYNARRAIYYLRELDEANRRMEEAADAEQDYQHKAAAKAIYKHYREPSVFVSKKDGD